MFGEREKKRALALEVPFERGMPPWNYRSGEKIKARINRKDYEGGGKSLHVIKLPTTGLFVYF